MKTLYHPNLQQTKNIPTGMSITSLFFGAFVPLFRGDFKWALISFSVCILGAMFVFFIPTIVMWIWLVVKYNDTYFLELLEKGWVEMKAAASESTAK